MCVCVTQCNNNNNKGTNKNQCMFIFNRFSPERVAQTLRNGIHLGDKKQQ